MRYERCKNNLKKLNYHTQSFLKVTTHEIFLFLSPSEVSMSTYTVSFCFFETKKYSDCYKSKNEKYLNCCSFIDTFYSYNIYILTQLSISFSYLLFIYYPLFFSLLYSFLLYQSLLLVHISCSFITHCLISFYLIVPIYYYYYYYYYYFLLFIFLLLYVIDTRCKKGGIQKVFGKSRRCRCFNKGSSWII